jgi:L-alanine-DL-glutamate epimerase-like enolase superfamily enzyme
VPNFIALEYHAREVPWWEDLLAREDDFIQDGRIRIPDSPGLGIELDWDVVEQHRKA